MVVHDEAVSLTVGAVVPVTATREKQQKSTAFLFCFLSWIGGSDRVGSCEAGRHLFGQIFGPALEH